MKSPLVTIELKEDHAHSVMHAQEAALQDLKEIDYALGQELLADAYSYGQSVRYLTEAGLTWSVEPLIEGSHYFESALSTVPIIAPLFKERYEAGKTKRRIDYLDRAITRNPDTVVYEAEAWEVEILNNQQHRDIPSQEKTRKGFLRGMFDDWLHMNKPSGLKNVVQSFSFAVANVAALPLQETYADAAKAPEHHHLQFLKLVEVQDTLKPNIHFDINELTGDISYTPDALDSAIEGFETRYRSRSLRLLLSGAATAGAANFIRNEVSHAYSYGEQAVDQIFFKASQNEEAADPASSAAMSCVLVLAHLIPASLTLAPLKKAATKVSEHCTRLTDLRKDINLLKFARKNGQYNPEIQDHSL